MKKFILLFTLCACLLLSACSAAPSASAPDLQSPAPAQAEPSEAVTLSLRLVDGAGTGTLLLAGEDAGAVYTLPVGDIPVLLDGDQATADVLEDGMMIDVAFNGMVMETFPAQLCQVCAITAWSRGTAQNPAGTYYDLCGLYLQVLEDLWETDPGLNSDDGLTYVGVDLSQAPGGLTEGEKSALAWRFAEPHGKALVTGTLDDLTEQGYITAEHLDGSDTAFMHWEDGVLFSITPADTPADQVYSLPVLFFNAEKWRSSLGAYFFSDCSALWPEMGTWTTYTVGSEAIS